MSILNIQTFKSGLLIKVFFSLCIFQIVFSDACVGFQRTWVVLGCNLDLNIWTEGP